jgi:hypothetical protein
MPSWGGYAVFFAASSMPADEWSFEFSHTEGYEYVSKMIGGVGEVPPLDLWEEDA